MLVLGLDLGTNSVGWALFEESDDGKPIRLVDLGTRIFQKAVEDKTPTPKNQKRRARRLARRLVQRRARRRRRLESYLIKLQLLPTTIREPALRESALNELGDPYLLRARALDQPLRPFELGRVLLHLAARRGFQSNRKTLLSDMADDPDVLDLLDEIAKESPEGKSEADKQRLKEEGAFQEAITELANQITQHGCRTLGEYLARLAPTERRRNRRTGREMYKHELSLILDKQSQWHPVLDSHVREQIAHIIFYQRPIRWSSDTIGRCSLEPSCTRAAKGRLEYQEFRYLQDLNNLSYEYVDTTTGEIHGKEVRLSPQDRARLVEELERKSLITWAGIRRILRLSKNIDFNLERTSKDKGIPGNRTACAIRKIIGDTAWDELPAESRKALVDDLISFEKKRPLKDRLIRHWHLAPRAAVELATLELEPGHANLSLKAINRLLPHMRRGLIYSEARQAAGYGYEQNDQTVLDRLPRPPEVRNPVVERTLHETRRVINAVIAHYGKPGAIRIELPRELRQTRKQKERYERQQKENQRANEQAREQYAMIRRANPHLGLPEWPTRNDLTKYRLWDEQNRQCAYTLRSINATTLFTDAVEIDHILPYSRTLDDSYMNKVLAYREANQSKGNRTPFEAFGGATYEQILQAARHLPAPKYRAFLQESLADTDTFINSQLSDTAYASRLVKDYVATLGCDVSVSKGTVTAWLRRQWGLNSVLGSEVKNREDHRHHAIDAAVTALVSRGLYQEVARLSRSTDGDFPELVPPPIPNLRDSLQERLEAMIVSHAPNRKLTGAFHEETAYGVQPNEAGGLRVVYRKPLGGSFTETQIEKVVDPTLRELLKEHLARHDNNPKIAFSPDNLPRFAPHQAPIRHARIVSADNLNADAYLAVQDDAGTPYKYLPFGNNHHVEILKNRKTNRFDSRFVTMFEAARRVRRERTPAVRTDHGPDFEFLMALHINDLVELDGDGVRGIFRVQILDSTDQRLTLRGHTAATLEAKSSGVRKAIHPLMSRHGMRAVRVNVLGHMIGAKAGSRNQPA